MIDPQRQQMVEEIVAAGDLAKHAADASFGFVDGHTCEDSESGAHAPYGRQANRNEMPDHNTRGQPVEWG